MAPRLGPGSDGGLNAGGQWALANQAPPIQRDAAPVRLAGRNEPCPCGSGRKYKRCCLGGRRRGLTRFERGLVMLLAAVLVVLMVLVWLL